MASPCATARAWSPVLGSIPYTGLRGQGVHNMRVLQIGLGPIGCAVSRLLVQKSGWHIVAAVDADPAKQGGDVVSSTEELFYPYYRYAEQASALDELAKQHGVSVLGTGINPGFVMDTLVLVLTGVCQHITRIAVTRVANASGARPSLQRKLGLGLTPDIFAEHTAQRHVGVFGLVDSLAFLAYILKWHMDDFKERLVPVIADKPVRLAQGRVELGQVCGVRYMVKGMSHGKEVISFDLRMYLEAGNVRDTIYIEGTPTIEMTLKSTDMGDVAAAGLLVNMSPLVHQARAGLLTMVDLPLPHWQH